MDKTESREAEKRDKQLDRSEEAGRTRVKNRKTKIRNREIDNK